MRRLLIIAAYCLANTAVAVECGDTDQCLRLIQAQQVATRSLSARIVQTKHLALLTEPLVNHGRFAFRAPDQILWRLDDPPLTVRIDAQGIHTPDRPEIEKEMAAIAPLHRVMREFSGMFMGNLTAAKAAFNVTARSADNGVVVQLVPRQEDWRKAFRRIELRFAAPAYVIESIRLEEDLGDSLEIAFSNVHRNDAEADAAFGR